MLFVLLNQTLGFLGNKSCWSWLQKCSGL